MVYQDSTYFIKINKLKMSNSKNVIHKAEDILAFLNLHLICYYNNKYFTDITNRKNFSNSCLEGYEYFIFYYTI